MFSVSCHTSKNCIQLGNKCNGGIILYTGREWEFLIRWIRFEKCHQKCVSRIYCTFCKQKEDFSVTLSAGYIVTPVDCDKWISLLVSYLIIHSCSLFKKRRNKSSDYIKEWVIVFIHCLYKGVADSFAELFIQKHFQRKKNYERVILSTNSLKRQVQKRL